MICFAPFANLSTPAPLPDRPRLGIQGEFPGVRKPGDGHWGRERRLKTGHTVWSRRKIQCGTGRGYFCIDRSRLSAEVSTACPQPLWRSGRILSLQAVACATRGRMRHIVHAFCILYATGLWCTAYVTSQRPDQPQALRISSVVPGFHHLHMSVGKSGSANSSLAFGLGRPATSGCPAPGREVVYA